MSIRWFSRAAMLATLAVPALAGCALFRAAARPATDLTIERTPARVARGDYLVNHVLACAHCHGAVNATTGAIEPTLGMSGGGRFGHQVGMPGEIYASNLTSDRETGLGAWTDDQILRAFREGVDKDGKPLFALMPYMSYRQLSDADARAVVAYLRTLAPVKNQVPPRQLDFPLNLIVNVMPKPLTGPVAGPGPTAVARGRYLAGVAACAECHTPRDGRGQLKTDMWLAGGHTMAFPDLPGAPTLKLPNITSDRKTGIGAWSDAQLKAALQYGQRPDGTYLKTAMPWVFYNGMTDDDLSDLIAYLRSTKPIASPMTHH